MAPTLAYRYLFDRSSFYQRARRRRRAAVTGPRRTADVRILYFADIRFPLERANGIQTMETCHALAERGHDVTLVVRPDTHAPARDPFAYYGLPPLATLRHRARAGRRPGVRAAARRTSRSRRARARRAARTSS